MKFSDTDLFNTRVVGWLVVEDGRAQRSAVQCMAVAVSERRAMRWVERTLS